MGFFDSILAEEGKTATATATAPTPAQQKAQEANSLIITQNGVTTADLADTVADMIEPEAPTMIIMEEEPMIIADESPVIIADETPTIITEEAPVLIVEEKKEDDASAFIIMEEKAVEAPVVAQEEVKEEVAAPVVEPIVEEKAISSIFTLDREPLSASEDSSVSAILGDAVSRLEKLQKAKQAERDEALAAVEEKNAAIANLKKEAKDLLDKSKELADQAQKITDMMVVFQSQKMTDK